MQAAYPAARLTLARCRASAWRAAVVEMGIDYSTGHPAGADEALLRRQNRTKG